MEISLTKKLANAIGVKPSMPCKAINPLFSWTANWVNTFDNRKEDTIVMINHANRFTIVIFGVKRKQFKDFDKKLITAIRNTLLAMKIDPEVVEEYLNQAGEIVYAPNSDRKITAFVNNQAMYSKSITYAIYRKSNGTLKFDDTLGRIVSQYLVNCSNGQDCFVPAEVMVDDLSILTGKQAYKYTAFELLITLDLDIYKATRRIIVDANLQLEVLHHLLQKLFDWKNYHLYEFIVFDNDSPITTIVPFEEDLCYDDKAILMGDKKLSDYFPKYSKILYTYDFGVNWEHEIKLVRVLENYSEDSPYLVEAIGQSPPEDVGGVGGFIEFREIMLDPNHPDYEDTCRWARYWEPELREYEARPRVLLKMYSYTWF